MLSFPARRAASTSRLNSGGSETMRLVRISEITPMGMLMKKTQRQEKLSVIHPPGGGAFIGGERVDQDGLFDGRQPSAPNSLQHAEENQPAETRREATQQRGQRKRRDAAHVVVLAAEDAAEPGAERQNDGVGNQVAGEHPSAFVAADGQAASDVRQRHIGDGGIEQLHEGRQGY